MTTIAEALKTLLNLAKADPKALGDAVADEDLLTKASGALMGATGLDGAPVVEDRWTAGQVHTPPTREEIKTGPTQAATGGNAARQVSEYSNVAPQHGVTEVADKFERILHVVSASAKAQTDAIALLIKSQTEMTAVLVKGSTVAKAEDEPEEEEEEEEEEVVESKAAKAKAKGVALFNKAKKILAQIKAHGDDETLEDDEDMKKALGSVVQAMKKSVAKTLRCASLNAVVGGDVVTFKAVLKAARKADIEMEEEAEEDDEKAKSKAAAAKAKVDDKGNQSDSMDGATGNQNDEAAKALKTAQDIVTKSEQALADALSGVSTLTTDVKGLMGLISGMSRADFKAPAVAKAEVPAKEETTEIDYDRQIAKARAGGQLTDQQAMSARSILETGELVKAGHFDISKFDTMLKSASPEVRALFAGFKITEKAA